MESVMPENCITENDLERVVDDLEDYSLNARNYQTLQDMLDSVDHITAPTAEKLLLLCIRDRIEDLKYTTHVLNIISTLLKKIENGRCTPLPDLVPSALAVLNVLYTTAECDKLEALKSLCFEIIDSYPDETLVCLGISHSDEIFKIIDLYCHQSRMISTEFRLQTINIVGKVLRVLPPDKRRTFVTTNMKLWFSLVIPFIVEETVNATNNTVLNLLEVLELLTKELVQLDYADDPHWQEVLKNLHTPEKYPALTKTLLEKGSAYWHRLWIIFIKLLKNQITKYASGSASPINALLPCVEMAFKMDVQNRCRAFLCWDVLIDNFSNETNETLLSKRLKLLMVPLTSNNAKVEETALAKFKTWWYLITRFQTKLDKFVVMVVIPFLSFCFGKRDVNLLIPGKISDKTKVQCVQAFINIVGHTQCEGCVRLPKLNVKVFNAPLLVNNWREWIYAIGKAIKICVEQNSEFNEKQIKCVWKSFIMTIGELPENNIRRDLYSEVLIMLEGLTQDCDNRLMEVIVNVLIPTLFNRDDKILPLLKSKNEQNAPINKIILVLSKLPLDSLEDRITALESIKLVTNWIVNDAFKTSSIKMELLVKTLSSNGVLLWTALADSINFCGYNVCPRLLAQMFLWPFKNMNNFANKNESTTAWLNLYKTMNPYLHMKSIHKDIINALMTHGDNQSSCLFVLSATIAVLENKLQQEDTRLDEEIDLILQLTSKVNETQIKLILPSLAVVIVHTLFALSKNINETIVENIMFIINNILKICKVIFKEQPDNGSDLIKYIRNIFNSLESTFKLDSYSKLKSNLVDQLKECAPYLKNDNLLKNHILAIYKTYINKDLTHIDFEEVVKAFEIVEVSNSVNLTPKQKENPKMFTTPSGKAAKQSKKEATITNTVIENGEEFVVVKSNWKFNPRKLTENQKEKLQRKREDIPAMYQDLSQSQDEFNLTTWKTDSQDTSTTSSKSTTLAANEMVSVVLKNLPNSEFFPKIMENVTKPVTGLTQNTESSKEKLNMNNIESVSDKIKNAQNSVKIVKSPRMALKDRVSRNVRNLIEKSNLGQEFTDDSVNILKTPLIAKVKPSSNVTNSAPSQIYLERPSRVKRKPKKFDDLKLFAVTRRRSLSKTDSQNDVKITGNQIQIENDRKDTTVEDKDKENNLDSQELINNSIDNSALITGDINIVEHHGNDKLKNKESLSNCFYVTENLNRTNDAVKKFLDKEKEACLESKNKALPMRTLNETDQKTKQMSGSQDLNNIDKTVHDKIKENICTVTLDKTLSTPKSNETKDSNNINQLVHDNIREKVQENKCSVTLENTLSTPKSNQSKDLHNINQPVQDEINLERSSRLKTKPKKFDNLELLALTKRRNSLSISDSQNDVVITRNQIQIENDRKDTAVEDKDKETNLDSQELINNSIDNNAVIQGDINTVEHHGNDKLKNKVSENLNHTNNDTLEKNIDKEKEVCLDGIKRVLPTRTLNETNEKTGQISRTQDLNNIDKTVHNKIQENICTVTLDKTLLTPKSNQPKDLNNINQSVHDKIKEKVQENTCSVTLENTLSTPKSNQSKDLNNINQPVQDKIKEKVQENFLSMPESNKCGKKVEKKTSTDCKKKVLVTPKVKIAYSEKGESNPDVSKSNAVLTPMDIKKKVTIEEKSCPYNTDKSKACIISDVVLAKGTVMEKVEGNISADDNTAVVPTPKVTHKVIDKQICSSKKSYKKKSRIERELAIDMVEGHPFLKAQSEKRSTRKVILNSPFKRKRLSFNPDNVKLKRKNTTKGENKTKDTEKSISIKDTPNSQDICASQDFIESSQDSAVTTISLKSSKPLANKKPVVVLEDISHAMTPKNTDTQSLIDVPINIDLKNEESNSDIELPCNKTDLTNLTEEMDTEPIDYTVFVLSEDEVTPLPVIPDIVSLESNTQNTADADTEQVDTDMFIETNEQRKKDFLDNTLQISPIKSMSPVRDEKSPSPETSSDYVVIKLTSPVQSNGQPFEICESPEIFTEDKVSPDKRNQSPPREDVSVKSTSPSSLSLKKNRPQMRSGGRAAQMLGLCVPDSLQTITVSEKPTEPEEAKRSSSLNISARRNLRILYNSSTGESNDTSDDTEDSESFLKFKRTLPATDCSPSGPILKRKLIDITDESTASPASKRKRVSFHDPPVSTTICVKKYIEPISIRSPQNSANKRLERQTRAQTAVKSPRRLENVFKLDSVLNKAVESFSEAPETMNEDTEMSSLDETPVVEVIKTSDLNDTDPICKELVDCEDHIENIAAELSSPAMKVLLVKNFEGKVECIGDLAKMTELEVNRLCIIAPKVQVAKKVLNEYLSKLKQASEEITPTLEAAMSESTVLEAKSNKQIQTDTTSVESIEAQTDCVAVSLATSQTDEVKMTHSFVQTNESGSKSTTDIITDCILQRPDFVESLCETVDEASKQKIVANLRYDTLIKIIMDKISNGDGKHVLSILQDQLVERFECKDLILFCSSLLNKTYDKPT